MIKYESSRCLSLTPVIQADQEVSGSRPIPGKQFLRPYLKNPSQKRVGGMTQVVGPESNPSTEGKKKKKRAERSIYR
jgi:hypothetical protein